MTDTIGDRVKQREAPFAAKSSRKPAQTVGGRVGMSTLKKALGQVFFVGGILLLWQLASGPIVDPLFVSSPLAVFAQIGEWILDGTLLSAAWATLWVSMVAFVIGIIGGIVFGYVFATWSVIGNLVQPTMTALYTLPKLVLAPLFILWFGIGYEFRVLFAAFVVFFFVYYNTYFGVREVPEDLIKATRLMGAGRVQLAQKVIAPSALTWVANGLKISLPYAFTGVIVAEMLAGGQGLGYLLKRSSDQFFAAGTFGALLTILVLAVVLDFFVTKLTAKALVWKSAGNA